MNPAYIEVFVQVVLLLLTGFLLPAARRWLDSHVHANDMDALTAALGRAAQLVVADVVAGKIPVPAAASGVVDYAVRNLPEIVSKLEPKAGTLAEMAESILLEKIAAQTKGG